MKLKHLFIAILTLAFFRADAQTYDFMTKYGKFVNMRKYDSTAIRNLINTKLNATDTASLSTRINAKLNISDTSAILTNYRHWTQGYATTSSLSGYVPTTRQLTINGTALELSANRSWSVGTVTSVATGTGLTGGTITGTGTIAADTISLSTRLWRQKGIDSVQANITAGLATKLNATAATGAGVSLINGSLAVKRLKAGNGVTITDNTDSVTVALDYVNGQKVNGSQPGFAPTGSNTNFDFLDGTGSYTQPVDYTLRAYALLGGSIKAQTVGLNITNLNIGANLGTQTMRLVAVYLPKQSTITGVGWIQVTQGNYTANNYNGVGLYTYSGGTLTLVASSTNDGNIWKGATGSWQTKAFSSTYNASPGVYYIGILYCSSAQTTAPAIGSNGNNLAVNAAATMDFTNSAKMFGAIASQTSLPGSQAMSGVSVNAIPLYVSLY